MKAEPHIPVLCKEILEDFSATPKQRYFLDGTFGRGGHTRAILNAFPDVQVVALDRDEDAVNYGKEHFADEIKEGRLHIFHSEYSLFDFKLHGESIEFDLMLLDLGVSSPQLDTAGRGFSFYHDGPLDMRMDQRIELTAADIIHTFSEEELIGIFRDLGEVRSPYRVVRAIIADRKKVPFCSTRELAGLMERVDGWRRKGIHPATKYFMALRMYINRELEVLTEALSPWIHALSDQGRFAVLTFHSMEDRIVKKTFKAHLNRGTLVHKRVVRPTWEEMEVNSRARSAKLRVFQRDKGLDEDGEKNVL